MQANQVYYRPYHEDHWYVPMDVAETILAALYQSSGASVVW